MLEEVNSNLRKYVEENVMPKYDSNNVGGHGVPHIRTVISRSFEIINEFGLDVNKDMVYAIAAFHDIGYRENPDEHEEVSSRMFLSDSNMRIFFTEEQIQIIAEAIVDHRASLEYEARSVYGKIVSSADRETSVKNMLQRSFLYQADKHSAEKPSTAQVIEYSFKKLSSKYGNGGYAKMYYPDKKYTDYLDRMQELLEDEEKFIKEEMKIAEELEEARQYISFK